MTNEEIMQKAQHYILHAKYRNQCSLCRTEQQILKLKRRNKILRTALFDLACIYFNSEHVGGGADCANDVVRVMIQKAKKRLKK